MRVHRVALAVVGMLIAASSLTAQAVTRDYGGRRNGKAIAYVSIIDAKGKPFASEGVRLKNEEIAALSLENELTIPHDPSTGAVRGTRQHNPIVFTHEVGPASPQLLLAAETHEILKTVTITIYRGSEDGAGTESKYFVLTLTNAVVIGLRQFTEDGKLLEDVSLAFQKLKLESNGKTSAEVSWVAK